MTHHTYEDEHRSHPARSLAIALGWFSIALGTAELVAPGRLARFIGAAPTPGTRSLLRWYGSREIGAGLGILNQPHNPAWVWSRVGGDVVDLVTIGGAAREEGARARRLALAGAAVAVVAALDVFAARKLRDEQLDEDPNYHPAPNEQAITVNAVLERVEQAWVDWCHSGYAERRRNYTVRLEPAPGARGTEVHLTARGSRAALRQELRQFKQFVETGQVSAAESLTEVLS